MLAIIPDPWSNDVSETYEGHHTITANWSTGAGLLQHLQSMKMLYQRPGIWSSQISTIFSQGTVCDKTFEFLGEQEVNTKCHLHDSAYL